MELTYDPMADTAYLSLAGEGFASDWQISGITCDKIAGEVEIDVSSDGKIIGIEFVCASSILPATLLQNAKIQR
ncbi:Uncharacterized conserved small protein [Corynebacterium renale]|uniref:DUF2283 domain-containing protein n=1 Tax=Corynebacterium renale TaxID=1724 RepID=UPI000DA408A9|nr:DUF2283 domain-containing protein [Corynebacterium renale]SQG63756.1 Uncharacterized conserved small protein [Corynebacterium renale]STD01988.1 Uncharacterized conserved small protein [Corynebacterium renale]